MREQETRLSVQQGNGDSTAMVVAMVVAMATATGIPGTVGRTAGSSKRYTRCQSMRGLWGCETLCYTALGFWNSNHVGSGASPIAIITSVVEPEALRVTTYVSNSLPPLEIINKICLFISEF
jgi:hypothetical protein